MPISATARRALVALSAAAWWSVASSALAHFPIARDAAFATDGASFAVALPGFGIVTRADGDAARPFSYICNALVGVPLSDSPAPMAFTEDGSLLIGTDTGLTSVDSSGCPRARFAPSLQGQPVVALAVSPAAANLVYAVTGGAAPRVARSSDGGQTWELRATLSAGSPVTSLVLDDTARDSLYVSQSESSGGSALHVSIDGGTSFSSLTQVDALTLLQIETRPRADAGARTFWAVGHDSVRPTAFDIFQASRPDGPWTTHLTVNYFGGFTLGPNGVVWVGDGGGGVYRSMDGGESFTNVAPQIGVACLHYAQGALFGCVPGTQLQPALVRWNDQRQAFDDVVALNDVRQMVQCAAPNDVPKTCEAAWFEWQRDVVMMNLSGPDAGVKPVGSGGSPSTTAPSPTATRASGGCAISRAVTVSNERARRVTPLGWGALGGLLFAARRSRRRTTPSRHRAR